MYVLFTLKLTWKGRRRGPHEQIPLAADLVGLTAMAATDTQAVALCE